MMLSLGVSAAPAIEDAPCVFDIPAGPAEDRLALFAQQAGKQFFFSADKVKGVRLNALKGTYPAREALDRLLSSTQLFAVEDGGTRALTVGRNPSAGIPETVATQTPSPPMHKRKTLRSVLAALFVSSGSAHAVAQTGTSGDTSQNSTTSTQTVAPPEADIVVLPQFTISEERESDYRSRESTSASRIRGALIDTPQSVSVLTREFMNDINPTRLYDATRYVAGVTEGRGPTFSDRIIIRGFENDNRTVDNFFLSTTANFDESLVERVEVVKGPNAILSPTGTPGGSINVITKSPQFKRAVSLTNTIGLYDAQRMSFDATGTVSGTSNLAYRFIGTMQDTDRNWDDSKLKQFVFSPQITYRFSPRTAATFKYTYMDYSTWGDPRVLIDPSVTGNADGVTAAGFTRTGLNGANPENYRNAYLNKVNLSLNSALGENISVRLAADYVYNRDASDLTQLGFPGTTNRYNPYTGILTPDDTWSLVNGVYTPTYSKYFDPTNVARTATLSYGWNQAFAVQNDIAAQYKFNGISSTSIVGWVAQRTQARNWSKTATLANFNLYAPVYTTPVYGSTYATDTDSKSVQQQYYLLQRLGFFKDRLFLTAGTSLIYVDNATTNRLSTSGPALLKDHHVTTNFGALGKVTEDVSLYYNYSSNAVPTTYNNSPLWQEGKQHEFGIKTELFDRKLSVTAAHFQITQSSVSIANPEYQIDKTQPQNLLYDLTNRGYEVEAMGNLTKDFSVVASGTWMHTRDKFGRRPRAIADRQAALRLNYKFSGTTLNGLSVNFGVSYTGDSEGDAPPAATALGVICQPSFKVPAYTKCSAGASYKWSNYSLRLAGDNIFNSDYLYSPGARFAVAVASQPNVTLTFAIGL